MRQAPRSARRALARSLAPLWAALAPALAGVVLTPAAQAQRPAAETPIRLNYVNADLRDVIRSMASLLGVSVVLIDVPSTRVTFSTPVDVRPSELGAVLESLLESHGLVLVAEGPVAQVMPASRKPTPTTVRVGTELPSPPPLGLITQIVPLTSMSAEEAVQLLRQVAPAARVEVVPRSNSVIITDRGVNVQRYLALLAQLEQKPQGEAGLRTFVYRLKHASAQELAETLNALYGLGGGTLGGERARVRSLEDRSLTRTLEAFRRRELESFERRGALPIVVPVVPGQRADTTAPGAPGAPGVLAPGTTIVPDPATNSLVIRTSPPNYPILQQTIEALDVRPPQVLLEVLIAEVTLDRTSEYGINWQAFTQRGFKGDSTRGVVGGFGPGVFTDSILKRATGLAVRVVQLGDVDVRAVLQALAAQTRVNVLSTPHVLALNNEEARILVGSKVPFNSIERSALDFGTTRLITYEDVGTQLTVIPTVNVDRYVTFRMLQEVSAVSQQTVGAALNAPIITTREAETSAIVRDGQTIVIGGLIDDQRDRTESGVPFLKDIPLLGYLFKRETRGRTRTELAIFVTPRVVFTDEEAAEVLERERARLRETEREFKGQVPPTDNRPVRRRP